MEIREESMSLDEDVVEYCRQKVRDRHGIIDMMQLREEINHDILIGYSIMDKVDDQKLKIIALKNLTDTELELFLRSHSTVFLVETKKDKSARIYLVDTSETEAAQFYFQVVSRKLSNDGTPFALKSLFGHRGHSSWNVQKVSGKTVKELAAFLRRYPEIFEIQSSLVSIRKPPSTNLDISSSNSSSPAPSVFGMAFTMEQALGSLNRPMMEGLQYQPIILIDNAMGWSRDFGSVAVDTISQNILLAAQVCSGTPVFCRMKRIGNGSWETIEVRLKPDDHISRVFSNPKLFTRNSNDPFCIKQYILVTVVTKQLCFGWSELVGKVVFWRGGIHCSDIHPGTVLNASLTPHLQNSGMKDVGFKAIDFHEAPGFNQITFDSVLKTYGNIGAKPMNNWILLTLKSVGAEAFACYNDFEGASSKAANEVISMVPNLEVWVIPSIGHRAKYRAIYVAPLRAKQPLSEPLSLNVTMSNIGSYHQKLSAVVQPFNQDRSLSPCSSSWSAVSNIDLNSPISSRSDSDCGTQTEGKLDKDILTELFTEQKIFDYLIQICPELVHEFVMMQNSKRPVAKFVTNINRTYLGLSFNDPEAPNCKFIQTEMTSVDDLVDRFITDPFIFKHMMNSGEHIRKLYWRLAEI